MYWNHCKQLMSLKCFIFISWLGTGHCCGAISQSVLTWCNFPAATWSHGVYWLQEKVPIIVHPRAKIADFKSNPSRGIRETTTELWGPDIRICVPAEYVCGLRDHNESHLSLGIVYNICSSFWGLWPMSVENGSWITQWTWNPISFQWSSSEGECIPQSPLTGNGGTSETYPSHLL